MGKLQLITIQLATLLWKPPPSPQPPRIIHPFHPQTTIKQEQHHNHQLSHKALTK